MGLLDDLLNSRSRSEEAESRLWGVVADATPGAVEVNLAGDASSTPIPFQDEDVSLGEGDLVWLRWVGNRLMIGGKAVPT